MSNAAFKPLEEPPAGRKKDTSPEDENIRWLLSDNPFTRQKASIWLRENGSSKTASRLERIMEMENPPKDVRREIGVVLLALSHRHFDFANTLMGRIKRMMSIRKAFRKNLALS